MRTSRPWNGRRGGIWTFPWVAYLAITDSRDRAQPGCQGRHMPAQCPCDHTCHMSTKFGLTCDFVPYNHEAIWEMYFWQCSIFEYALFICVFVFLYFTSSFCVFCLCFLCCVFVFVYLCIFVGAIVVTTLHAPPSCRHSSSLWGGGGEAVGAIWEVTSVIDRYHSLNGFSELPIYSTATMAN